MSGIPVSTPSYASSSIPSQPPGIDNNDQGFYQNKPDPILNRIPVIYLGYLSNWTPPDYELDETVVLNLNPICVKWCDFTTLFFRAPGGAFWINPNNTTSQFLAINNQTYTTTQNKCVNFSLTDQIKKAWSKKNNKPIGSIPPNVSILMNRTGFLTKSLANIRGYLLGLSIDEAISSLLDTFEIQPGNPDTEATVEFVIVYRDYFKPLDISIIINFTYVTKIPCYKNTTDCFVSCGPYSNDCDNCRNFVEFDVSGDYSVSKKSVVDFEDDDDDLGSEPSKQTMSKTIDAETTNSSAVIDELSKIIKSGESVEENTVASSKWAM
jgi:hypothetical protein